MNRKLIFGFMMHRHLLLFFLFLSFQSFAQQEAFIRGTVRDTGNKPLYLADVVVPSYARTLTNEKGEFFLKVPSDTLLQLTIQFVGKRIQTTAFILHAGETYTAEIRMEEEVRMLDSVVINKGAVQSIEQRREVSLVRLDPKIPKYLPSAFNDFNKILVTLPGVYSNSELTSQYNVRGGNYDENLVYVNDMEIYRPQIVRAGQQEGLSFVNPDLVKEVEFSSGGWQPRWGDKLASVLSVKYKTPHRFKASASGSLLGGTAHIENASRNQRVSYVIGARQKSGRYLLNTLPTKGQYKPRFFDIQSVVNIDLTKNRQEGVPPGTTLSILTSFARNRYFVLPDKSETRFGTDKTPLQLEVDFDGKETLEYETFQTGAKLSHQYTERLKTDWILSVVRAAEREYDDVEGAYKLSEVNDDPNSSQYNQSVFTLGSGSMFNHTRNKLTATIAGFSHKGYYNHSKRSRFQWGVGSSHEVIQDHLDEYSFIDSAGYTNMTGLLNTSAHLNSWRVQGYAQHSIEKDSLHSLTYGVRLNYWTLNGQLLASPRIQYAWQPRRKKDILYKMSLGVYQQPPFYRELRDWSGIVHTNVRAQSSVQFIAGRDYNFKAGGTPFKFVVEVYGKYLWNVNPYDVDNVRIRYYATNNAIAYIGGADFRINGEFVKDLESWFSLGIQTARENLSGDGRGFIRRPTDQRVTAAIFLQDHLPNNPSLKAYVNLVYGSGLPFGPPNNLAGRAAFSTPAYRRVDIGFSKLISYADKDVQKKNIIHSLWISAEVLNILGVSNTISYLWITDINNRRFPVPNELSARFVNLRIVVQI